MVMQSVACDWSVAVFYKITRIFPNPAGVPPAALGLKFTGVKQPVQLVRHLVLITTQMSPTVGYLNRRYQKQHGMVQ